MIGECHLTRDKFTRTAVEQYQWFQGNGASAILGVSYGNRDYDDTLIELFDVVKSQGIYTCIGGVAAIAEHSIMHQFASSPDMDDMNQLKRFAKEVKEKNRCFDFNRSTSER